MSDKQKPETAVPAAPAEVNEEALDQVNGGKASVSILINGCSGGAYVFNGLKVARYRFK